MKNIQETQFMRQKRLPFVGEIGQAKILNAKVLVVGLGGLGTPFLNFIAMSGLKHIGMFDNDLVELSNLSRQSLYNHDDLNKAKVDVCIEKLSKLNPKIKVSAYKKRFELNDKNLILDYDYIIDGTDNFKTKYLLHDLCFLYNKKFITGSIYQMNSQVTFFDFTKDKNLSACWRCLSDERPKDGCVGVCQDVGVLGTVTGSAGTSMAQLLLNDILEINQIKSGTNIWFDHTLFESTKLNISKNIKCKFCNHESVTESFIENLYKIENLVEYEINIKDILIENEYYFIDIRDQEEKIELPIDANLKKRFVGEIFYKDFINNPTKFKYQKIVFICFKGLRSLKIVQELSNNNYFSLANGVEAFKYSNE